MVAEKAPVKATEPSFKADRPMILGEPVARIRAFRTLPSGRCHEMTRAVVWLSLLSESELQEAASKIAGSVFRKVDAMAKPPSARGAREH